MIRNKRREPPDPEARDAERRRPLLRGQHLPHLGKERQNLARSSTSAATSPNSASRMRRSPSASSRWWKNAPVN
ncbi:MAG: hypothetical protein MZV70_61380 [Desulfobacterales bacterium]|nr:hypothetical protein [Desulfobacterales bacterium]